jgi:hypothetical protein
MCKRKGNFPQVVYLVIFIKCGYTLYEGIWTTHSNDKELQKPGRHGCGGMLCCSHTMRTGLAVERKASTCYE